MLVMSGGADLQPVFPFYGITLGNLQNFMINTTYFWNNRKKSPNDIKIDARS